MKINKISKLNFCLFEKITVRNISTFIMSGMGQLANIYYHIHDLFIKISSVASTNWRAIDVFLFRFSSVKDEYFGYLKMWLEELTKKTSFFDRYFGADDEFLLYWVALSVCARCDIPRYVLTQAGFKLGPGFESIRHVHGLFKTISGSAWIAFLHK